MANDKKIANEVKRRRTFAIVSHPDAGKTTLTERLLLLSGAIQMAGTVRARKSGRYATSDWMEIEKQRGISVASSVMQMDYRGHVINLLDTPGHKDFSEDTYRVLTAVDAALMIIDGANGIEERTRKLLQVCRARNLPIITFVNKLDRETREPLSLTDEIERELGIVAVPFSWPIGSGKGFAGVYDLRAGAVRHFRGMESGSEGDAPPAWAGEALARALPEIEFVRDATEPFDHAEFLAGHQTPVLFGSAISGFGVQEVLDTLVEFAPAPSPRESRDRKVDPVEEKFSGIVFKIQANMDPQHRDRIAFVRVCSGRFERGMKIFNCAQKKSFKPSSVVTFMSRDRETVEEAYPGDIIGIPNHGTLRLGDTLTEGEDLQFGGLPYFAPEIFRTVLLADPLKGKQLRQGLDQLCDEGAIQVFRLIDGGGTVLGAVGVLQFDVVAHRLQNEYGVNARIESASYIAARWIASDDPVALDAFITENRFRIAHDAAGQPAFLARSRAEIEVAMERAPKVRFHTMREQTGALIEAAPG